MKSWLCAILILAASPAAADDAAFVQDTRAYLDRLERLGFAGAVIAARHDTVLLAEGYGLADRESGRAWTPETVSDVGSITKQFTAAAILKLQEDGKLSTEDLISKHLPDVPEDKGRITIHHLLTHTSGITDGYPYGDFDPVDRERMREIVMTAPLVSLPGEQYAYSNAGFSLLGMIVERVSGQSYETFLTERLLDPAGMKDTGYRRAWPAERIAQGYDGRERWGTSLERPWDADGPFWTLRANGGIHSTCRDMVRWANALLSDAVLTRESRDRLWTPFADEGGGESYYGYGWSVTQGPGGEHVVTHNGGNGYFFADFAIVPEAGLVVYLHTNVAPGFPQSNRLLQEIGARWLAGAPYPEVPEVVVVEPAELRRWPGSYELGADRIVVESGEGRLELRPEGPEVWRALFTPASRDSAFAAKTAAIDRIVGALLQGDVKPLHEAYGGRVAMDVLEQRAAASREEMEGEIGPIIGHEVLGSAPLEDGVATFVRINGEEGARHRQYIWSADDSLRGYRPLLRLVLPSFFPQADGRFRAWGGRLDVSTVVTFQDSPAGSRVLVIGEGDRALRLVAAPGR